MCLEPPRPREYSRMNLPLLSIVIVSFNTRDLLGRCLASVVHSPYHLLVASILDEEPTLEVAPAGYAVEGKMSCEVIVVDNASLDGSAKMVLNEYPGVRVLDAGENLGFARATNWGLREARGDLLLLLNPRHRGGGRLIGAACGFPPEGWSAVGGCQPGPALPGRARAARGLSVPDPLDEPVRFLPSAPSRGGLPG